MTHPEVSGQFQGTIKRPRSGLWPNPGNRHTFPTCNNLPILAYEITLPIQTNQTHISRLHSPSAMAHKQKVPGQNILLYKKKKERRRKRKEEGRKRKKLSFSKMKHSNCEPTGAWQGLHLWVLALHSNAHNCFSKLVSHTAGSCSSLIFSNLCSE